MTKFIGFAMIFTLLIVAYGTTIAQTDTDDTCSVYVQEALTIANDVCVDGSRNSICYGNIQITSTLRTEDVNFEETGDRVPIADIETMELSPLDLETDTWGIAIANIQANLPDTLPGQLITVVVFGDTELTPTDENLSAFIFRGNIGAPACNQAPNGLLIQTPSGIADVTFTVNGIDVSMGSTAYIVAEADDNLLFALLEGDAAVTADGSTQQVNGGEFTTVPLDSSTQAIGVPTDPEPIVYGDNGTVLPSVVDVSNALMPERIEIDALSSGDDESDETNEIGDTEDISEAEGVAGGIIQPLDGTWRMTAEAGTISAGCPPSTTTGTGTFPPQSLTFSEPFSQQEFFTAIGLEGLGGASYTYSNPSDNIYVATADDGTGNMMIQELTIASETEMTNIFTFDFAAIDCTVIQPFYLERIGD